MRFLDLNPLNLGEVGGAQQPGLSSFFRGEWIHGNDAFAVCREDPQSTLFPAWENLSINGPTFSGGMRHTADVAMAQLKTIIRDLSEGEWIVLTPSHWQKDQLQVFLGIAAECKMDVRALLPRVLAVNHALGTRQESWTAYEWHWQRLNRLSLTRDNQGWKIKGCETVPEGSVLDFFRRESKEVSKVALESQRVDPLYSGKTEQLLFEGWWSWHHHGGKWAYQAGEVTLDFSKDPEKISQLHHTWMNKHSISKKDSSQTLPSGLSHCLGFIPASSESDDLTVIESRLGDLSAPGARRKEVLAAGPESAQKELPVTHWVLNGIAEKAPASASAQIGQLITLADGREALAIHVPGTS